MSPSETEQQIQELALSGWVYRAIAELLQISTGFISQSPLIELKHISPESELWNS